MLLLKNPLRALTLICPCFYSLSSRLLYLSVSFKMSLLQVRDQDIPVKRNLVRVIVNVDDTNDNAPWFIGTPYSGRVFESAAVGSAVLQVTALDKDKGSNAEIVYSIESGKCTQCCCAAISLVFLLIAESFHCKFMQMKSARKTCMSHLESCCPLDLDHEWNTLQRVGEY